MGKIELTFKFSANKCLMANLIDKNRTVRSLVSCLCDHQATYLSNDRISKKLSFSLSLSPICPLSWRENSWMHTFSKGIIAM